MYKWDANDYDRNSSAQQEWAGELIENLHLQGNERILDIGCGDGKTTARIASLLPQGEVLGLDLSPDMVAYARRCFSASTYPNLSFVAGDAGNLEFREEFDVVFSNAALHWVLDHIPVLHGIARSLKPGGKALLQMGGRGNAAAILNLANQKASHGRWSPFFKDFVNPYGFYSPEEYQPWLAAAGLSSRRVELIPKDMVHRREELAGWVRTTWLPFTQRIPVEYRDEYIAEVVDDYLRVCPPDNQGRVHVKMVRLEVEAFRT